MIIVERCGNITDEAVKAIAQYCGSLTEIADEAVQALAQSCRTWNVAVVSV